LTVNFSAFLADSGGWVTSAGLTVPFSGTDVAAHITPEPQKSETEMMRQTRIDLLNLDSIGPPKTRKLIHPALVVKTRITPLKFKENLNSWDSK
jgi:hypothetical protein